MTRAEKFMEMKEGFKNELLQTFPEISNESVAINALMGSSCLVDCESITCPEDGDCEKCESKNYWTEEYGIEIGDEVWYNTDTFTYVVGCFHNNDKTRAICLTSDDVWAIFDVGDLHATGRYFPEISEVLKKLRGRMGA